MLFGYFKLQFVLDKYLGLTFPELEQNADYKPQMFRYNNYQYEVRFLRAYFYFNLVRQYGDVPFTDHFLSADESNTLSRTPAKDILIILFRSVMKLRIPLLKTMLTFLQMWCCLANLLKQVV